MSNVINLSDYIIDTVKVYCKNETCELKTGYNIRKDQTGIHRMAFCPKCESRVLDLKVVKELNESN